MGQRPLLHCWIIGDLHYRALPMWSEAHTQRLAPMFEDLHTLWQTEDRPNFCVSPGDLVETYALENHQMAKTNLEALLGDIPFYPGIGNHEYYDPDDAKPIDQRIETYLTTWNKPLRYAWKASEVACIMLDYPDPATQTDPTHIDVMPQTLAYLDATLTAYAAYPTLIFLHCPLRNTVLDRDPEQHRDYNSLQNFFSPENSQAVRDILAQHPNACLYFSGHTHSGWEAPYLVSTEELGSHPITFVNVMSPWYTGRRTGLRKSEDGSTTRYIPDVPNVLPTFSIRIYRHQASIRVRDHHSKQWLKEWIVPCF